MIDDDDDDGAACHGCDESHRLLVVVVVVVVVGHDAGAEMMSVMSGDVVEVEVEVEEIGRGSYPTVFAAVDERYLSDDGVLGLGLGLGLGPGPGPGSDGVVDPGPSVWNVDRQILGTCTLRQIEECF